MFHPATMFKLFALLFIITELSLVSKIHSQTAYSAFTSRCKHKFTFFMRTLENIENSMLLLDRVIKQNMIPALFNDFKYRKN